MFVKDCIKCYYVSASILSVMSGIKIDKSVLLSDCSQEFVLAQELSPQLVKVLSSTNSNTEVIETCLEFITNLADDGDF